MGWTPHQIDIESGGGWGRQRWGDIYRYPMNGSRGFVQVLNIQKSPGEEEKKIRMQERSVNQKGSDS